MTRELFWLTLTVILTGLLWVPYIINRCQVRGLTGAMAQPLAQRQAARRLGQPADVRARQRDREPDHLRAAGADPQRLDYSDKWTVMACAVYFWSRVAHLIVYTLGLPVFRTLAFTVGFLAQAVLALAIFKVV